MSFSTFTSLLSNIGQDHCLEETRVWLEVGGGEGREEEAMMEAQLIWVLGYV